MRISIIRTLLWKNTVILRTHLIKYLLLYLSPLLIFLLLLFLQSWTNANFTWVNDSPEVKQLQPIPKCSGDGCLTIGYIIEGRKEAYMDAVIAHLKSSNHLSDADVRPMQQQSHEIMNYLQKNPNKTQAVLVFCSNSSWKVGQLNIPCFAQNYHLNFYTIIYNLSLFHRIPYMGNLKESYPKDYVTIKMKADIDQAIIKHYQPNATVDISFSDFPSKSSRFIQGVSIVAQYGSFFVMIPYLILMVMEGSQMLFQKEKRLRIGLNIVGVTHLEFYLAQILTYLMNVTIISASFVIFGLLLDIKFFSAGLTSFDFSVLVVNGMILGLVAFCITACVSDRNLGMSMIYGFILYSIVMQWFFTGGFILELLYMDNAGVVIHLLKYLFNLYPSFHFSKIFSDVNRKADSHFDTYENRFVEGTKFAYDDLFTRKSQFYQKPIPHGYTLPSTIESFYYLLLTSAIYLIALFLFDRFIESNRGYREKICNSKRNDADISQEGQDNVLVRIVNLQKVYANKVFALTGITANLVQGEIVALLGENGAGKSTLINILIGSLSKSNGDIYIRNKNIESNIDDIRKIIGVCPQFDILWEELTAGEHIEMFYNLKGIPHDQSNINNSLNAVHLLENKAGKVSTFSGGMRRRLSLSISLIGNPQLLILDQPTTGMDAKIRLLTWRLILKMRKSHTVLITTHNMEEAECVSDRIMIMSKGRITAAGSALQLKRQFGEGYIVKGYDRKKNEEIEIKCKEDELEHILQEIEKNQIENWSLHETTLQEVFLSVSQRF